MVTSIRGNSLKNYISNESPLGRALMGKKTGDVCKVKVSDEVSYEVKIVSIDKSNDDSSDSIKSF